MNTLLNVIRPFCLLCALCTAVLPFAPQARADSLSSYGGRSAEDAQARRAAQDHADYLAQANKSSLIYLEQARGFRTEGRYELARQRYLQALSICADDQTLSIIKRELSGVEMLLRTMR